LKLNVNFKGPRNVKTNWQILFIILISSLFCCFHLYTAYFGLLQSILQRAIHLMFALSLCFCLFPTSKNSPLDHFTLIDAIFIVFSLLTTIYLWINLDKIIWRTAFPLTSDVIMAIILIILVLEMARRTIGLALPVISVFFLLYALLGSILPPPFTHRGYSLGRIISTMYMTTNGIFGIPLGVSATFIALFILFGSFLEHLGGGKFFIDLANALVGKTKGGPAKVAVIASGAFGSISGSAAANVATTGTFTIPLMKKMGYSSHFAGAVEAVASTGGMIMPPIMGSGAFIMAEILGIPYFVIIKAAFIPALLYYSALLFMVHSRAVKLGLKGLPIEEIPKMKELLLKRGYLLLPLITIIVLLVGFKMSPMFAALGATFITIVVSFLNKQNMINLKKIIDIFVSASENIIKVASACACAGIVIGILSLTGLGLRLSIILPILAQGNLYILLVLTMIGSLILGMGLPATAAYILLAVLGAPALSKLGVLPLAAHLFVFYFGCLSNITPPVCVAGYVASGISGASINKIGFEAMKLGVAGFLVPYFFVFNKSFLFEGSILKILFTLITGLAGVFCLAAGLEGVLKEKINHFLRIILILIGIILLFPSYLVNSILFIILIFIFYINFRIRRT